MDEEEGRTIGISSILQEPVTLIALAQAIHRTLRQAENPEAHFADSHDPAGEAAASAFGFLAGQRSVRAELEEDVLP